MRKKRRVPVVLWRLFRDRAQTLATAIASLIPPHSSSPPSCNCNGRRFCLNCCGNGENAMSFLLQPRDPVDYRNLLNHCFVVVNDNAPPVTVFRPLNNWPQREIVVRTIEMIIREQAPNSNVICSVYDKCKHSSPIVELLTSPAWSLLLKRVGDDFMIYLLKHTSIFLPFPLKKHHQVTGSPVSNLVLKFVKHKAEPPRQDPLVIHFGDRKKRGRFEKANSTFDTVHNQGSISCVGCNDSNHIKPFSRHPANKYGQMNVTEATAPAMGDDSTKYEGHPNDELENPRKHSRPFRWQRCKKLKCSDINESTSIRPSNRLPANRCVQMNVPEAAPTTRVCSSRYEGFSTEKPQGFSQVIAKSRKHSRLFRWQRWKKRRHSDDEEASDRTCCLTDHIVEDSAPERLQYDLNRSKSYSREKMPQQGSCFIALKASHLDTKGAQINRQPIFYNFECSSSVLPQKHLLNSLKPNFTGSKSLIGSIFGLSDVNINAPSVPCSHSSSFCLTGSACLYHLLAKLFKILIRRSHCCKHVRLLDKHCMVSSLNQVINQDSSSAFEENDLEKEVSKKSHGVNTENYTRILKTDDLQTEAIKSYCSKSQVVSFIWAVCRNLIPPDLLGTSSNWRILRRNISKFIQLRRFEKFSLKQCMHKLKTSEFPFLSKKHSLHYLDAGVLSNVSGQNVGMHKGLCKLTDAESNLKHMLLEKWIFWFFSCLVVPLLQANFYVTESEHGKQDVFYYRKSIWEKLKNRTIACLKDQNYQNLDASAVESIIGNRLFGFSKLRLRPKENGARMLANLKAPSRMPFQESSSKGMPGRAQFCCKSVKYKHFKSVNSVLRETYAVLKGIQLKEPEKLGSSVFDYNDIYKKLCLFIIGLKNELGTLPNIFIVVSDVSKAFDSINQDKLLSVMKDVILEDEYILQQSSQVVCTKKSLWVHENLILTDPNISTGLTKLSSARFGSLHSVLVNQGFSRYMKKKELLFNLNEHVKRNVLQVDKKFYLQGLGIPQGSILSSLLCSLYYGHLERNVIFPFLEKIREPAIIDLCGSHDCQDASAIGNSSEDRHILSPCYMLLRLIDDFCFISTSKKLAAGFYTRLQRGFWDYNCYMNEEKFCLNFDTEDVSELPSNRVYVGEDGISFLRWSGLLLNSCTLEVQADYTRYLNNHLRSTLTVTWQGKPGRLLKAKLCNFMRPKCHPIFFDSNINSGPVVRLNIYQAFLLCAMKYHCYVSEMSYICKLQPRFHLKIIEMSFRYMYVLIKKKMRSAHTGSHLHPVLQLEAGEVEWLGLNAFIEVLKRKQSRHKELVCLLKSKLFAHKINGGVSSQLDYAIDSSHSSVMWKIKY